MSQMTDVSNLSWRDWLLSERPQSRMQARLGRSYMVWRRFTANKLAVIGLFIIIALLFVAAFANVLAPHSPYTGDLANARLLPPGTPGYLLGTDDQRHPLVQALGVDVEDAAAVIGDRPATGLLDDHRQGCGLVQQAQFTL